MLDNPKPMGFIKSSAKIEVHGNTSLPEEERETLNPPMFVYPGLLPCAHEFHATPY